MTIDKKTIRKVFWIAVGSIFFYWLLHETDRFKILWTSVKEIFAPFVIGAALAFILNVLMRPIEHRLKFIKNPGLRRAAALVLTFVAIVLVLTLVEGGAALLTPANLLLLELIWALPGLLITEWTRRL